MNKLTEKHFSFKCPMSWDAMEATTNGRYCGKCRKEVFDLTNCSIDEVIALQRKHGSICGSIRIAQAAAVAASLSAAACTDGIPVRTTGTPQVSHQNDNEPSNEGVGKISPVKQEQTSGNEIVLPGMICPPEQLEKDKGE